MSKKKVYMLRLRPEVYTALEKWATDEFRSVNGQLEWILDKALKERGRFSGKPANQSTKDAAEKNAKA